jgi:hypothetical protein
VRVPSTDSSCGALTSSIAGEVGSHTCDLGTAQLCRDTTMIVPACVERQRASLFRGLSFGLVAQLGLDPALHKPDKRQFMLSDSGLCSS